MLAGTAAVALALVGAILIVVYAQGADQRALAGTQPVDVLVVKTAIPAGTPVEEMTASLETQTVPAAGKSASALNSLDGKAGTVAAVDLVPGEQLLAERLVSPAEAKESGAVEVPTGMQEVSFQLEPQRIAGGRIAVGDRVGMFLSFEAGADPANEKDATTQMSIRKALVTAVQRAPQVAAKEETEDGTNPQDTTLPEGSLMLTVAVNDVDAGKIVFASEFGRLWLTKEPLDAKDNGPRIERKEVVYK